MPTLESEQTVFWSAGEPPKDGELYCCIGQVTYSDEWGGESIPFLSYAKWNGHLWIDDRGLALARMSDGKVRIFQWSPIPI